MDFYIAYEKIQQHCISGGRSIYYAFLMIFFIFYSVTIYSNKQHYNFGVRGCGHTGSAGGI